MEENYSVLMSIYEKDNSEYLQGAIDSMLNQTIKPEQFVLVVDGPITEELEWKVKVYAENPIFTIVRIKKNGGLANALNTGLEYCRNDLVARMDADDISLPKRCEAELKMFANYSNLVVCGCNIDEFYEEPSNIHASRIVPAKYDEIKKFGKKRQPFNHPTVMYKKGFIKEIGGYPLIRRKEDFDLFSRILVSGAYVRNIDKSLYLYRADEKNYLRRKSKENVKAALYVYTLHKKRGGCSWIDYIVICGAEVLFYILPLNIMKILSDKLLRK